MIGIRAAVARDLPAIEQVMALAIAELQRAFLSPAQIAASHAVMGLDRQLVADRTYFVAERGGAVVGCGGWSWRATLYGGDHSTALRDATPLVPSKDAARMRAMYTHPDHARTGIASAILDACEQAAAGAGFGEAELMSTAAGEPLYVMRGYQAIGRADAIVGDVTVPLLRMTKAIFARR